MQPVKHSNFPNLLFHEPQNDEDPGYYENATNKHAALFVMDCPDGPSEITVMRMLNNELCEGELWEGIVPLVRYYDTYEDVYAAQDDNEKMAEALCALFNDENVSNAGIRTFLDFYINWTKN